MLRQAQAYFQHNDRPYTPTPKPQTRNETLNPEPEIDLTNKSSEPVGPNICTPFVL